MAIESLRPPAERAGKNGAGCRICIPDGALTKTMEEGGGPQIEVSGAVLFPGNMLEVSVFRGCGGRALALCTETEVEGDEHEANTGYIVNLSLQAKEKGCYYYRTPP